MDTQGAPAIALDSAIHIVDFSPFAHGDRLAILASHARQTALLIQSHCLMGNLPLSASHASFPPTLNWSLLQGRNVAHPLWSRRGTWSTLKRKRKVYHEANRGRSLSSPHTDRPLHVSKGGERGTVIELSSQTRITPTGRASVP